MTRSTYRVLVTDGNNRAALAVTRSLGRAGHHVVVGERRLPALAAASRYCADRVQYPDPARDEAGFIRTIEEAVQRLQIDVLLPVADITTWLIAQHRATLEPKCRIPCPPLDVIERAADKADVVRTALRLGVPVPRTVILEHPGQLATVVSELTWPVVIKPRRSRIRTPNGWLSTSVRYAASLPDLEAKLAHRHPLEFPILLQELIEGPGAGVFTCLHHGHPVAWFGHRRLREKPPTGGVSVLCESVPVPDDVRRQTERLLAELDWQDVAMVEFKQDSRDGVMKLMEVNGRFWGSLQLAIDAGVDFPTILLSRLNCSPESTAADGVIPEYRVGVKSRWWWGDVDSLLLTLRTGRGTNGAGRLRTVRDFLTLWGRDLHYENPRWSDLGPWWYETRLWLNGAG